MTRAARALGALARDRVVQFLVIGAVLFALAPAARDGERVSLRASDLTAVRAAQAQRLGVTSLSGDQRDEVDDRAIEDAVLYREALRLGLDRDDAVLRRYLVQKVLMLAEDLADATREPTTAELEAYFAQTRDHWRVGERIHLIHVFGVARDRLAALAAAVGAAPTDAPPALGDAFPASRDVRGDRDDVATTYGAEFAAEVDRLPVGVWSAPIESRYGWHLVRVLAREPGRPAALAEVRDQVRLACTIARKHAAIAAFVTRAFARYRVEVDGAPVTELRPTARLAQRATPSAED